MRKIVLKAGESFDASVLHRSSSIDPEATKAATEIVDDVIKRADEALIDYTKRFDGADITDLEVTEDDVVMALSAVDDDFLDTITYAADSIRDFHERQLQQSWFDARPDGSVVGQQVTPLRRVGIYVPGGRAAYPSTVLMNAIPAAVAGVDEIVMCTPPGADGTIDPYTLAAANIAGVDRIFKVGGAQAIAAMAYGTQSIPRVDKITGPGNAYVAAAKKLVSGDVGIDMIAGPSEVCVMADESSIPEFIAVDLLAQAEHDPQANCYLVTVDETIVEDVENALDVLLEETERREVSEASLEHGLIIVCETLTQAFDAVEAIAPEHLELHMSDPLELLGNVRTAGAVFLGPWTPEAVGDYVAGPNHTLPTGGTAAFSSPLSVDDFMKKTSVLSYSYEALEDDAEPVEIMAAREGLWAHGYSVGMRLQFMEAVEEAMEEGLLDEAGECTHGHAEEPEGSDE